MQVKKPYVPYAVLAMATLFIAPAFAQEYHGALAVNNKAGVAGGSYDMGSIQAAEKGALKSCNTKSKGRPGCEIFLTFKNGCVAAYHSSSLGKTGYAFSESGAGQAEAVAYRYCVQGVSKAGLKNDCRNILSFCTTRMVYY